MGVSGSGKTTVGKRVATLLDVPFADADAFHPALNVAKMQAGEALTDADREPWLVLLRAQLTAWKAAGTGGVMACSALKASYRDRLDVGGVAFRLLTASPEVLQSRLENRFGHFFNPNLLDSQLATLEPAADTPAFDTTSHPPEAVARSIVASVSPSDTGLAAH